MPSFILYVVTETDQSHIDIPFTSFRDPHRDLRQLLHL
ncbi:hypothetical protein PEKONANI_03399 [Aeromonas jandaei]